MDCFVKTETDVTTSAKTDNTNGGLFNFRFQRGTIHYGVSRRDFVKFDEKTMFLVFLSRSNVESVIDLQSGEVIKSNISINKPSIIRIADPRPIGFAFGRGTEFIAITASDEFALGQEGFATGDLEPSALEILPVEEPGLFREIKRTIVKPYLFERYRLEILEAMLFGALSYFADAFRANEIASQKSQRSDERFVTELEKFIDKQIDRNVSIKDIARHFSVSVSSLNTKCSQVLGRSPHAFVIEKRIALAKNLLINTRKSIAEISLECGFSSQAHLSFTFKKIVGVTPRQFRMSTRDVD